MDLGKRGVRVNSVCPSLTRTGMTADMMDDQDLLSKFAERIPLGRVCEPREVGAVIAFLASEDASFMTGENVTVDGWRFCLERTAAAAVAGTASRAKLTADRPLSSRTPESYNNKGDTGVPRCVAMASMQRACSARRAAKAARSGSGLSR